MYGYKQGYCSGTQRMREGYHNNWKKDPLYYEALMREYIFSKTLFWSKSRTLDWRLYEGILLSWRNRLVDMERMLFIEGLQRP